MRAFIKISLCGFIGIIAFLLITPKQYIPQFYDIQYIQLFSLASFLFIYFLPIFLKISEKDQNAKEKNTIIEQFQMLVIGILYANILGDLGLYQLYKIGFQYDKLLHFLIPFFCLLFFPKFLHIRFEIPYPKAFSYAFVFIISCGILWELSEYFADIIFKTHIFGIYGQKQMQDTTFDLFCDFLGSSIGFIYKYHRFKKKDTQI